MHVCFCCVRFSSSVLILEIGWEGRTSPKWRILCRVGRRTLTQSICSKNMMVLVEVNVGSDLCSDLTVWLLQTQRQWRFCSACIHCRHTERRCYWSPSMNRLQAPVRCRCCRCSGPSWPWNFSSRFVTDAACVCSRPARSIWRALKLPPASRDITCRNSDSLPSICSLFAVIWCGSVIR